MLTKPSLSWLAQLATLQCFAAHRQCCAAHVQCCEAHLQCCAAHLQVKLRIQLSCPSGAGARAELGKIESISPEHDKNVEFYKNIIK
jgi:hypothetical protein